MFNSMQKEKELIKSADVREEFEKLELHLDHIKNLLSEKRKKCNKFVE